MEEEMSLLCPLCLDIFRSPKILPCFHTFCEGCLQDLVDHGAPTHFSCPSCREEIRVPSEGVTAFRTNFYLEPEVLARARRNRVPCTQHTTKAAEHYCLDCDIAICMTCYDERHPHHNTELVADMRTRLRNQLDDSVPRLSRLLDGARRSLDEAKDEQQALEDKKAVMTRIILGRHAMLQAAIDKQRDETLALVERTTNDLQATLEEQVTCHKQLIQELIKLQQRALDTDSMPDMATAVREVKYGCGSEGTEQTLLKRSTTIPRPVVRASTSSGTVLKAVHSYFGKVSTVDMAVTKPQVILTKHFLCQEDQNAEVCSVCPAGDKVYVFSEQSREFLEGVYTANGQHVLTFKRENRNKVTYARLPNGQIMYPAARPELVATFAKRCDADMMHYKLVSDQKGRAVVRTTKVLSLEPFRAADNDVFSIECVAHRAFDVDASEELFMVLTEAQAPDFKRTVLLYRRPMTKPIATYVSPSAPFQPSDVCFYRLGGREVLLVADELNDAIHVVNVHNKNLIFSRYLVPACPLLVQPTALNTDTEGRLWVGCMGGRVLVFSPVEDDNQEALEDHPQVVVDPPAIPRRARPRLLCC